MTNDDVIALRVAIVALAAAVLEAGDSRNSIDPERPASRYDYIARARRLLDGAWADATRPMASEYDASGTTRVAPAGPAGNSLAGERRRLLSVDRITRKWAAELVDTHGLPESEFDETGTGGALFLHVNQERQQHGLELLGRADFTTGRV